MLRKLESKNNECIELSCVHVSNNTTSLFRNKQKNKMLRRTFVSKGWERWPWPAKLPLKAQWWKPLSTHDSIAQEVRYVQVRGDLLVCATLFFIALRSVELYESGAYQTRLKHLNGHPPAIIAQEFDFKNPSNNRKLTKEEWTTFQEEARAARANHQAAETYIFKY